MQIKSRDLIRPQDPSSCPRKWEPLILNQISFMGIRQVTSATESFLCLEIVAFVTICQNK